MHENEIHKISELREKDDGDWDDWPAPVITITSRIAGELRRKILNRTGHLDEFGTAGDKCEVTLIEMEIEGGYSEHTIETDYDLYVKIDGEQVFHHSQYSAENCLAAFFAWAGVLNVPDEYR